MNKQWEPERSRVEHANDARITLTIALHGDHAWEMLLEDSNSYHSIRGGHLIIRRTGKPSSRRRCVGSFSMVVCGSQQRLPLMRPMVAPSGFPCTIPRSAAPQRALKTI
jgi:hypothetical protein